MKIILICLAAISLVHGKALTTRNIDDDIIEFTTLAVTPQFMEVIYQYLTTDLEVQSAISYIQTTEFNQVLTAVQALPEYQEFDDFLQQYGVDFNNVIHPPIDFNVQKHLTRGVGFDGFLDDLTAALPEPQLERLFENKITNSPDFKALYNAIISPEFQVLLKNLTATKEYQALIQTLEDRGIVITHVIDFGRAFFGVHQL
ncbi:hypothetical protein C0J52_05118 [Blattella germanica]|nr:hypothetical protein C0J52_05118 [Blattella germanica]PSN48847.1 hypothetical protein C0J52_05118 [Blattella germanica]